MKTGVVAAFFALIPILVVAQAPQKALQKPYQPGFSALTGEGLVKLCKNADSDPPEDDTVNCLIYIGGFTDGYNMAIMTQHGKQTYFCPVQEVTTTQMAKVVVKYGNDHPEKLWMRASMLTLFALRGAYPCEKN